MSSIIIVVVVIIAAFILALMNGKKRQEVTFESIRIVRGAMDAFDEESWAWPEGTGEVIELHPLDTCLDGTLHVSQIKGNTIKFTSTKPFIIEGVQTNAFELARFENLTLEDPAGIEEPIILSYETMMDPRVKELTPAEQRKRTLEKIFADKEQAEGELEKKAEELEGDLEGLKEGFDAELDEAADEIDDLNDQLEDQLGELKDKLEDKVDELKDKIEDALDEAADESK